MDAGGWPTRCPGTRSRALSAPRTHNPCAHPRSAAPGAPPLRNLSSVIARYHDYCMVPRLIRPRIPYPDPAVNDPILRQGCIDATKNALRRLYPRTRLLPRQQDRDRDPGLICRLTLPAFDPAQQVAHRALLCLHRILMRRKAVIGDQIGILRQSLRDIAMQVHRRRNDRPFPTPPRIRVIISPSGSSSPTTLIAP